MLDVTDSVVMECHPMSDNPQPKQPVPAPDDRHESLLSQILDALPFVVAAIVVIIIVLALMGPAVGVTYSNIIPNL